MAAIALWKPPFAGTVYGAVMGEKEASQSGNRRPRDPFRVRAVLLQATTGQTDWLRVPTWATHCRVTFDLTAVAGTTPQFLPQILSADPITLTDTHTPFVGGATLATAMTGAGQLVVSIGPGVTGIANDLTVGASGNLNAYIDDVLPSLMGIQCVNDRDDADETYSYTITCEFRGGRAG